MTARVVTAKANVHDWRASGYASVFRMTPASFAGYVKARKEYRSISTLAGVDGDGIYLWSGSEPMVIDETAKTRFNNSPYAVRRKLDA